MENLVNVLIIDDEKIKINQLSQQLKRMSYEKGGDIYKIIPQSLDLPYDMEDIIKYIRQNSTNAVIIDYKLNSKSDVQYNGVELSQYIRENLNEYPMFILTSFDYDVYNNELCDSYYIFDYVKIEKNPEELKEFTKKIIEQVLVINKKIDFWKKELVELLPKKGESAEIDSRILEIDNKLELALGGERSGIPPKTKKDLFDNTIEQKLNNLLEKVDKILEE